MECNLPRLIEAYEYRPLSTKEYVKEVVPIIEDWFVVGVIGVRIIAPRH